MDPAAALREALAGAGTEAGEQDLRRCVLRDGVVDAAFRPDVWYRLLGAPEVDSVEYVALVERGASRLSGAIETDLTRTLAADPTVASTAGSRTRLLNAWVHWTDDEKALIGNVAKVAADAAATARHGRADSGGAAGFQTPCFDALTPLPRLHGRDPSAGSHHSAGSDVDQRHVPAAVRTAYAQGMGSIAATLLAVMPEPAAFACFRHLVTAGIDGWFEPGNRGVHLGCSLADELLAEADPALHAHFISLLGPASSHAPLMFFSRIAALYANRPPMSLIIRLWDALLAFGTHFVIVLCVAEACLRREELMAAAGRDAITRFQVSRQAQSWTNCLVSMLAA